MIPGLDSDELRDLILSVGTHKSQRVLTPPEVAMLFKKALDAGVPRGELAEMCLLESTTIIGRFLKLLELRPSVREVVTFGNGSHASLSFTQAMEIAGLPSASDQQDLADLTRKYGFNKREVVAVRQKVQRSSVSVTQAAEDIRMLRPTIIETFVFVGAIEETAVHQYLAEMLQGERDEILAAFLEKTSFPGSGHLGVRRFNIATDDSDYAHFDLDDFAERLNRHLAKLVG